MYRNNDQVTKVTKIEGQTESADQCRGTEQEFRLPTRQARLTDFSGQSYASTNHNALINWRCA